MKKQGIFVKRMATFGFLLILFLGAFSIVNATMEADLTELIEFSTFLGGTGDDSIETVSYAFGSTTVDSKGNIIVVGRTESTDFPLKDAFQDHINGLRDSTISKFHPNGSLIFSTYLGGSAQELITDVAVDSEDNIIVAGITGSADFPVVNALKSNSTGITEGSVDSFITKISEDGQSILYSTFFGGSGNDWLYTVNVYSNDRIAISGTTDSTDLPLLNPHQDTHAGGLDVFVAFLEADGQSLLFSTYIGSPSIDHGRRVDFDSLGNIWVTGIVGISDLATAGAYQEEHAGGTTDAFLAKFNYTGTLEYLTFLGGEATDWGNDLSIDSEDNIVITGFTTSDEFPTSSPYQDARAGYADMFITKFTSDGQSLVFSTYLGGSSPDYGNAITIDSHNRIVVTGQTESDDFPTTLPYSTTVAMHDNVSIVVLNPEGSLLSSFVFGGGPDDIGIGVTWHSGDSFIVVGYTESADFPIYQAYQETYAGDSDMFIMRLDLESLIGTPTSDGFPLGLLEGGIIIGIVIVVVLLIIVRKRTG
ncbi:hypothetical protein EU528_08920 [Candidatus Thorarchaeota archaeon]|nr:MAG: hypothetical protein EU528_08920 [Candidatus Thorarchaeota archaeon]